MCLGHKWLQSTWRRGEILFALVWSHAPPFSISFWALVLAVLVSLCFYLLLEGGEDWKPPRMPAAACRETLSPQGWLQHRVLTSIAAAWWACFITQTNFPKCLNGLKLQFLLAKLKWLAHVGKLLPVSFLSFCLYPCVCAFSVMRKYTFKLNFSLFKKVSNSQLQTSTEPHNTLKYLNSSHAVADTNPHIFLLILRVTLTGDPLSL